MQVVCSNCQLSFQAPDGATGLVCPICRSPLRAADAPAEADSGPVRQFVDWNGGTLDELVALLSAPAWSARVEVLPAGGGNAIGEVHVIAGGVSEAIHDGKSTHDALDKLRAAKGARFKIEPRLPNPSDGDLMFPGPEKGKLEERPLATLMRYCEEYVLTSGIEVWRGNENAKVDYRRGEIVGVTVGGIDAPERLAEVMKWSSGNYRLHVPKLTLPDVAPKAAPAPPAAVAAPRSTGAASKTIFGMPALDPAAMEKVRAAQGQAKAAAAATAPAPAPPGQSSPSISEVAARASAATAATATTSAPASAAAPAPPAASAAPAPAPAPTTGNRSNVARTIFGIQAPVVTPAAAGPAPTAPVPATAAPVATAAAPVPTAAAPVPTATAPVATAPGRPNPAAGAAPTARPGTSVQPPAAESAKGPARTAAPATQGSTTATARRPAAAAAEGDRTLPTRSASKPRPNETPVWTYVGVGFVFGLALLGVYRLVLVLAH